MFSIQQLTTLLAALPDPAFILTRGGRYAAIYGGSDSRYYHDGSYLIGKCMQEVLHEEKCSWFMTQIAAALASRTLHIVEYELAASDVRGLETEGPEHVIWFEGRIQALDFLVDGEEAVLWVASNITRRHQLEIQLRTQCETDPLTGLMNRRKMLEMLALNFDIFDRYKTPATLIMFDVDAFKDINDKHGHLVGDSALLSIAALCKEELRTTDHAARFGGDEFVILMPHTQSKDASLIIERVRQRIAESMRSRGIVDAGTISGGFSELTVGDASYEDVIHRADQALYKAKRAGGNMVLPHTDD